MHQQPDGLLQAQPDQKKQQEQETETVVTRKATTQRTRRSKTKVRSLRRPAQQQAQQQTQPEDVAAEAAPVEDAAADGRHERAVHEEEPVESFQELDQQKQRKQEP